MSKLLGDAYRAARDQTTKKLKPMKEAMIAVVDERDEKPTWPICRMERESDLPNSPKCPLCHSSLAYKIWPFKSKKCIQPKCENYYKKKGE